MRINAIENGEVVVRDMTEEEISEMQKQELNYLNSIGYEEAVDIEIRKKYSTSAEFAILRQKDEKPEEYAEYYAYCEECKAYVKKMIAKSNLEEETPGSREVEL